MAVDDLYIPDGVFLKCDQGATITNLQVNFKKHKLYGEIIATKIDNLPITNIPCFGACSSSGSACIPKTPEWKNIHEGGTKVEGQKPLLITSYCKCMQGGNIDIFYDEESALAELESDKENRVDKNVWIDAPLGFIMDPFAKITGSDYSDLGRGLRQGGKKSWNGIVQMVSHPLDTLAGLGKLAGTAVIGYMPPTMSEFPTEYDIQMQQEWMNTTAEERIAAFDKDLGTDLTSIHEGIKKAGSEFWDRKIENGTQVERDVLTGEAVEFVAELVAGSKGMGAALKTTSQGAKAAITAVRESAALANVSEKTAVAIATVNKFVQVSRLGKLAKSIKGIFKVGRRLITPKSLGIKMLKDNPQLMEIFDEALSRLANSKRNNAYKRYIEAKNNNFSGLSKSEIQNICEEAWNTTRSKISEVSNERGITLEGEIHHWNYPKYDYPHDVLNPNQLTEPIDRSLHTQIHQQTTLDPSKPWEGPINPDYSITPPPYNLP